MCFRLMVAILDFSRHSWYRREFTLAAVLLDPQNDVAWRKFCDHSLESRHPINIWSDGYRFDLLAYNIVKPVTLETMYLCSSTDQ